MKAEAGAGFPGVKSYVLRTGRISAVQRRSYENLFADFGIVFKANETKIIEKESFFGNNNPLVVEIGFGMGKATVFTAWKNPEINYLGIEVYKPGIGRLLWEIEKNGLQNIRIVEGDAAEILKRVIADKTVSAFHIFFPDPWPKKRHHKRRLLTRPFTDLLAAKLISGGYVYMVSDWKDYAEWALKEFSETPGLVNRYNGFAEKQSWRPQTEFEKKAFLENREIRELFFKKNNLC